jgi:hypothetical protein
VWLQLFLCVFKGFSQDSRKIPTRISAHTELIHILTLLQPKFVSSFYVEEIDLAGSFMN